MKPLKIVILAAGKSTRMKSDVPKVLHMVAGRSILRWVVTAAQAQKPQEIIAVVGHGAEEVRAAFKDNGLTFVVQQPQLGTGHAVMQTTAALRGFTGDVMVLSGDAPLLKAATLQRLTDEHRRTGAAATLLTATMVDAGPYGRIVRDDAGHVARIVEKRDLTPDLAHVREINGGTYIFDAAALLARLDRLGANNAQKEYYLTDVIGLLRSDGLAVAAVQGDTLEAQGVNTRKELALCDKAARSAIMDELMLGGVTVLDPDTTYIEADVVIGRDTIIYPCTAIHAGVTVGQGCEIGPFAHLRSGTQLGDGCKVGAFVETKNAVYGDGSKSGHLAYLGDVKLGKGVNIGAGTIVANYDGKSKHKTEIGDGAFIGCGTVLVAPVKVGKNAQTGANTVVPKGKDVADGTVVVGAPARVLRKKS